MIYDVQDSDEEVVAEEIRELRHEVDVDVLPGSNVVMVQGFDADEDEEDIRHLYEEVDSDEAPGSDVEGEAVCLEEMSVFGSDSASTSSAVSDSVSNSKSMFSHRRFVQAVFNFKFGRALAVFKPEFARMRMIPNTCSLHWKRDHRCSTLSSLLACYVHV